VLPRITTGLAAAALATALVACGPADSRTESGQSSATGGTDTRPAEPDDGGDGVNADEVRVRLAKNSSGTFDLTAQNTGATDTLVLAPVGEPERKQTSSGVTLTYVRPDARPGGDVEQLYEAFPLPAGHQRVLTTLTFPTRPVTVTYCLEVFADPGAVEDGDIVRAHGREADEELAVACSDATTID